MIIFDFFLSENLIQTHQIAPFKKIFAGGHAPNPPSKASRHANFEI